MDFYAAVIQDKTPLDEALCAQIKSSRGCVYWDVIPDGNQDKSDERTQIVKYLKAKVELNLTVPTEIEQMKDKESVPLYLKLLESGSEKKRDIRLVVVGRKGAGKTSLIKRLFQESGIATKTNGIEIHQMRCKADLNDGIWTKINRKKEVLEINARLLKPYKQSLKKHETETKKETAFRASEGMNIVEEIYNRSNIQAHYSSSTAETTKGELLKSRDDNEVPANLDLLPSQVVKLKANGVEQKKLTKSAVNMVVERRTELPTELAHKDIRTMLQSEIDFEDNEEYASVFLWDFAGDEEFYHTHQTFLSQDAIYLVVTQLNEADTEGAQDMFRLWMDSIHCYCKMEEQQNMTDSFSETETIDDKLDPPIVIVGTFKDKVAHGFGQKVLQLFLI
ncbi:uncharacterized protein [Mytilus edulis]|uniref:uncharacterized protein n=1 Tax=Mytilus edulis TaxID=6550 RepID=UPI0039EF71CE